MSERTQMMRRANSQRVKAAAGAAILASSCVFLSGEMSVANAFVLPGPSSSFGPVHSPSMGRISPPAGESALTLGMAVVSESLRRKGGEKRKAYKNKHSILPPPTPDEETDLLTAAVEYRRLKDLESDLVAPHQSPAERASAAGYGTDVDGFETALYEGQKARDALVTRNMGLVHHVVTSIVGGGGGGGGSGGSPRIREAATKKKLNSLTRDDLIQEGAIGLARAIDRYDKASTNGARFATYAVYWIRASVLRCISERDDLVRVPEYVSASVGRLSAAASRLGYDLHETTEGIVGSDAGVQLLVRGGGKDADEEEGKSSEEAAWRNAERAKLLAEEAGLTDRQLAVAVTVSHRRRGGGYTAFEPWMQSKMVKSNNPVAVTPSGDTTDDVQEIRAVLSEFLKPKEMEALSLRYGLNSADSKEESEFRDYEDEAMEGLFGAGGLLASSSLSADGIAGAAISAGAPFQPSRSTTPTPLSSQKSATAKKNSAANAAQPFPQGGRWGEAMSFAEVGRNMAVSAEYGRRLTSQALSKLRAAAEEGRLEEGRLGLAFER